MTEGEIRELCEAFFDAYEDRRVDVLDRLYADDCIVWHNVFGRETSRDENLERFHAGYRGQRRRTYDDRTVNTFHDGFVIRYSLNGVQTSGHHPHRRVQGLVEVRRLGGDLGGHVVRRDWETLQICDRSFDAIEQKDFDTLASCYAPEAVVWHSHDCRYQSREDNLAMLEQGMAIQRKVRFRKRRIRTFEGGFVQQHTIEVTWQNGFEGRMDVCFVGYTRDGRLTRAYEYFDTAQIDRFLGPRNPIDQLHQQPPTRT